MATKAEKFRYEMERSKPPRASKPPVIRLNAGTKRARGVENGTSHEHTGVKGGSNATVVIEENLSGRPSRKSTRASANGAKAGSMLDLVRQMKSALPSSRHNRRG